MKGCSVGSTAARRSSNASRFMGPPFSKPDCKGSASERGRSDADGLSLVVPGGKAGLVKTEEFPARMLALAFGLLWTDHPLARDATLTRSGAEPRDQALLGWQLASLQLLPDHRPDAIEVHCPTSASLIFAVAGACEGGANDPSCYPRGMIPTTLRASFYEGPGRF